MNIAPRPSMAGAYMAHHSRSFRFATLVLGPQSRGRIERVYAWCRHTDNLVDDPAASASPSVDVIDQNLDEWIEMSRLAYTGQPTALPLLDQVMTEMRAADAPFKIAEALVTGVRSDLRFRQFDTMAALRVYTHDVASVVGLWLCALHGVRDPWMLTRAAALGHAMQLTNILRDVGEDLEDGRIYLPLDLMLSHGLSPLDLREIRGGKRPIPRAYRSLIEDLMSRAEADYRFAAEAIPHLPAEFSRSVALAAAIYAGIHDAIRENGYDNFTQRASTSLWRKVELGVRALRYTAGAGSFLSTRNSARSNVNLSLPK